jgi:hypothetical protein
MTRDPKSSRSWGVYSNMDRSVKNKIACDSLIVQFFEHSRQSGNGDASKFRREDGDGKFACLPYALGLEKS